MVTGATGGVGSVSIDLLAAAGYQVVASTGKPDATDRLRALGAGRSSAGCPKTQTPSRGRWARRDGPGAVDCVGGATLADVLSTVATAARWRPVG